MGTAPEPLEPGGAQGSDSQAGGPGTYVSQGSGCWWPGALLGGPQAPFTNWRMGPDAKEDRAGPARDMCGRATPHEGLPRRGTARGQRLRPGQGVPTRTVDWPPPRPGPHSPALPGRSQGRAPWSSCRLRALSTDGFWATYSGECQWEREGPCTRSDRSSLWVQDDGHSSPSQKRAGKSP